MKTDIKPATLMTMPCRIRLSFRMFREAPHGSAKPETRKKLVECIQKRMDALAGAGCVNFYEDDMATLVQVDDSCNQDAPDPNPGRSYGRWPITKLPAISMEPAPAGNSIVSVRAYGDADSTKSASSPSIQTAKAASPKVSRTNSRVPSSTR